MVNFQLQFSHVSWHIFESAKIRTCASYKGIQFRNNLVHKLTALIVFKCEFNSSI